MTQHKNITQFILGDYLFSPGCPVKWPTACWKTWIIGKWKVDEQIRTGSLTSCLILEISVLCGNDFGTRWRNHSYAYLYAITRNTSLTPTRHQMWRMEKCVRFEVFTAVRMMRMTFWVLAPCRLVGRCQRFEEICLHLQGWKPQISLSEPLWGGNIAQSPSVRILAQQEGQATVIPIRPTEV
jgi:hypothetical protein